MVSNAANRRPHCFALFAMRSALLLRRACADAQSAWPNRQIRIVVPFAPGGASDISSAAHREGAVRAR